MDIERFKSVVELAILAHWQTHKRSTNEYYVEHARNNSRIITQKCEPLLLDGDGAPETWYFIFAFLCGDFFAHRGEPNLNELEELSDEATAIHSRYERQTSEQ